MGILKAKWDDPVTLASFLAKPTIFVSNEIVDLVHEAVLEDKLSQACQFNLFQAKSINISVAPTFLKGALYSLIRLNC